MKICKEVVSSKKLMAKLQESRFDVLLADAVGPCHELLTDTWNTFSVQFSLLTWLFVRKV